MRPLLPLLALLAGTGTAVAQDVDSGPPPAPPIDSSQARFDAGFAAMIRGDFAAAASMFRAVAASSPDPDLRGSANQLGRLADDYARRGARLSFGAPAGVSEDDAQEGGRASFVVTTTIAALYSGVVLVDLADTNDVRAGTLIVMGSTAVGLASSLYGTRGHTMTGGMADSWSLGLMLGVGNSLLLSEPLGLFDSSTNRSEKIQLFVLGSAWGGAAAGLIAADKLRPTRAQVSVVSTIGAMGVASTLLGLAIVQPSDLAGSTFLTITAAGLDAGIAAGAGFAGKLDWSLSRARLVGLSAFLGALAGGGTSLLLFANDGNENSGRLAAGITLAGLWGGFALGTRLTQDMSPDYRFRKKAGSTAMLAPTVIGGGPIKPTPGVALTGSF